MKKPHAVFVLAIVAAALVSAAISHGVIDVLGDFVLRHDAFDDTAHGSRGLASSLALLCALPALRLLLAQLLPSDRPQRIRVRIDGAWIVAVTLLAAALSIVFVPAMEWFDLLRCGADIDSLDDLFGGSIALGIASTLGCCALIAGGLALSIRWFIRHHRRLAESVERFLTRRPDANAAVIWVCTHDTRPLGNRLVRLRCRAERGPPVR